MGARNISPAVVVMGFGFLGVILAFIEKTLFDRGVMVTALATAGLAITDVMTISIVIFILIGIIIAFYM